MPGRPAARITDMTTHGIPAVPGLGAFNVLIGYLPAWRTIVDTCICPIPIAPPAPAPHGPEKCYMGSTTVLINRKMACRMGDILQGGGPPNPIAKGWPTVLIGDIGYGMAEAVRREAYARAMREIYNNWDTMTVDERRAAMEQALNDSLDPNMPDLRITPAALDADTNGQLDFPNWQVEINEDMLSGDMTEERFAALTNTVYHEGRHGEQWFNAAQYRASEGDSSDTIERDMGIPENVADAAAANPRGTDTSEGAMGESAHTSIYGDRAGHRSDVYDDESAEGYDNYRALPEEEDAFRQGDAAEEAFNNT